MPSPSTTAREAITTAMATEFTDVLVLNDRLSPSLGISKPVAACFPLRERANDDHGVVLEVEIGIQFYLRWNKQVEPTEVVDPAAIEDAAERFRGLIRELEGDDNRWFYNVDLINYPPDPTGNMTRFEAVVRVSGRNNSIVETV